MIFTKLYRWFLVKLNSFANRLRGRNPIAEMQYERDLITEKVHGGRHSLEEHRGILERLRRQVDKQRKLVATKEAEVRVAIAAGDRELAATLAGEWQKAKADVAENDSQLQLAQTAYDNNVVKVSHGIDKVKELHEYVIKRNAQLDMTRALAEAARAEQAMDMDLTTKIGQADQLVQDEIDRNMAVVQVTADLSRMGIEDIRRDQAITRQKSEMALEEFEKANITAIEKPKTLLEIR